MAIDLRTGVGREIYYHGSYEPDVAKFISQGLEPGGVVIDCGANIGELTLRASQIVGPKGKVYAVEASPQTAACLRGNLELNAATNVEVVEAALADCDAKKTFFLGSERHSLSSSLWEPTDFLGETVSVQSKTMTTLLQENGISRLDLIKMDIEGAELAVLRGAESGVRRLARLPLLLFEYNKRVANRAGWTLKDMFDLLTPWGYELFYLEGGQVGRRYCIDDEQGFDEKTKIDMICRGKVA